MTTDQVGTFNGIIDRAVRCKNELVRVEQMISRDMIELVSVDAPWLLKQLAAREAFIDEARQAIIRSGNVELIGLFRE